ncbi:hypothetical protein IPM62_02535 [Candidatus Woesebacteria bacterium]|nr:MAG: hypothetical protein IPM62_02535 [Candidatus Woesebacteria bacterium]
MAKTKYKEYVDRMLEQHKKVFDSFQILHDAYTKDPDKLQDQFNQEGAIVLDIIHDWEDKLCKQSEKGGYSQYTPKLAEKFQMEVKNYFPLIDHIGIKVSYAPTGKDSFYLKKIDLK